MRCILSPHARTGPAPAHHGGDGDIRFYVRTAEAWDAMYQACAAAKTSIVFEQYIAFDDENGRRFLALFAQKAREGVKVRLLFDRFGSFRIYNTPLIDDIRRAGGKVDFYNDIAWHEMVMPWRWLPRDHVKQVIIDDRLLFIGGTCIAGYMAEWADVMIRMPLAVLDAPDFDMLTHRPGKSVDNPIFKTLIDRIDKARRNIAIATPYFLPPERLLQALDRAAERGVRINLLVAEETDIPAARSASLYFVSRLDPDKYAVHLYQCTVCHAKFTVIDDEWAMVGSANLDYLSLCRNREKVILSSDSAFVGELSSIHDSLRAACKPYPPGYWDKQPMSVRLTGRAAYAGRRYL